MGIGRISRLGDVRLEGAGSPVTYPPAREGVWVSGPSSAGRKWGEALKGQLDSLDPQ